MSMPAGLAGVLPKAHGDRSASAAAVARGLPAVLTHGRSERNGARGQGPRRSADFDRRAGGDSGLIVVILSAQEHNSDLNKALPGRRGVEVPGLGAENSTIQRHNRRGHTHRQTSQTVPAGGRRLACCHAPLRGAQAGGLYWRGQTGLRGQS
ncbi:hypothetical protein NDU88_007000 [Pleurodeles waltl]|uniref:Uncharacterized protein n=1 Tax=Pleurodeles waltl TaxID=8319 RepID=A0AAV7TZE2_PLEWA|nr:hypothetical protein NDU88_007000 [Pleurodeles waltl]